MWRISLGLICLVCIFATSVYSADVNPGTITLNWSTPEKNSDGSDVNDLAGYRIYEAPTPPAPLPTGVTKREVKDWPAAVRLDIGLPETNVFSLTDAPTGLRFFGMTAYDTSDNESVLSSIVSLDIPLQVDRIAPGAPGGMVCDAHFPVGGPRPYMDNCRPEQQ